MAAEAAAEVVVVVVAAAVVASSVSPVTEGAPAQLHSTRSHLRCRLPCCCHPEGHPPPSLWNFHPSSEGA